MSRPLRDQAEGFIRKTSHPAPRIKYRAQRRKPLSKSGSKSKKFSHHPG